MIPVLYPSTETAFENNGLGGLPDAISCVVTEQRNTQGGYFLEMEYPIDGLHYDLLAPERIIYAAPSMGNTPQPFRISRITRPINGIVHIEAPHLCAELQKLTSWGVDTGTNIQGMIYNQFYRARQLGQTVPFWCETDITVESDVTFSHPEPTSLADILLGAEGSVLDVVGGEYEWDGYHIILHRQRGVDSGLEIRYGVNMSDLEAETDATELVTACVPYWKGTVNDVETVVIGDMCSASNASAYAYVRCVPLDVSQQFEETDTQPTKAQVTAKGQAFIDSTSRKLLQTSIRVSYEPTTNGIGERLINLCDTVRVVYPDLNVSSISKVVETRFNVLTERYDELTIGTIRNNIVDTIAGLISGGSSYSGGGSSGGGGGSSAVTSVNGMTGDVVLTASDVGALPNTYTAPVTSVNGMTGDVVVRGGGGAVDSVNGQTGVVVLDAEDVGAVAAESGAVLKNYLASDVKSSLGKADNAVLFTENQGLNTSQQGHARANIGAGISTVTYQNNQLIIQNSGEAYKVIDLSSADVFSVVIQKTSSASTASKTFTQIATAVGNGKIIEFDFEDSTTGESYYSFDFCVKNGSNNLLELEVKFCRQVSSSLAKYFVATFYSNDTFALSEVTLTGGSGSGSGNFVKITYNSNTADVTHNGTAITGSQIKTLLDQNDSGAIMVDTNSSPNAVYRLKNIYSDGQVEFEGEIGDNIINVIVPANGSTGNATVTRKPQVYYYLDGTTVKSAQTSFAVTGQQIQTATMDNGLAPIIYKYESSDYITYEYHFFSFHSGGLNFRTLDGKKLIFVPWGSSTATITQSAGWAANIVFYLDGTTVKYTGTNTAVTGNDVAAMTLANGNMPVIRQLDSNDVDHYYYLRAAHSGGMEFRLLDGTKKLSMTYNSSTATITQEYHAVTLNADGTVNTFDSALTYSAAAASVTNGNPKKLIVTWGNSIFTADADEKLSGANGDVKFICDVEHDGIQRHMIFTLTSANALQTTLIETYSRVPITVWEVSDVTQGLIALNTNISSSLAWQLTNLNLSPFKRIKIYAKAGRKTGAMAADSSIVPAAIIEMLLDDRAKETVSQNVFIGSAVVQNPNDANRLGMLTCAVSGDKTKFAVVRATSLYGTAATSNTDCYQYVFKIEGYYD